MISQLLEFTLRHWVLSLALVFIVISLFLLELRQKGGRYRLSLQEATVLMNQKNVILIDIRDKVAFEKGHILHAFNLPKTEWGGQWDALKKKYQSKTILLVDDKGQEAVGLASQLRRQGLTHVYTVSDGVTGWMKAGLPVTS